MTVRHVAQRIPFRPNGTQKALLEQCFGARRFVYNQQVEAFNTYDKETNPVPEYPNVTDLKNRFPWLGDCPLPSNAMSQSIRDFAKAKGSYFRKAQYEKNRPRFASRNDNIQSFRNCTPIRHMEGNRYPLSRKLGSVRIRKRDRLRYPIENLSSWTVKRENRTYYLVLLFTADIQPMPEAEGHVGIDLGVKNLLTLSTGEKISYGCLLYTSDAADDMQCGEKRHAPAKNTIPSNERLQPVSKTTAQIGAGLRKTKALPRELPAPTVPQADRREPIHRPGNVGGTQHGPQGETEEKPGWTVHA